MLTLQIEKRDKNRNVGALRKTGKMPAVFYGKKTQSSPISVDEISFLKVWRAAGESSIVFLKDGDKEYQSLIYNVDTHPVTGRLIHADFYVFEKGQKMSISVPIIFEGESPIVKQGGVLVKVMHEIEVEAEPKDLPHEVVVDISGFVDYESVALARDIKIGAGVELITDPEEVVASVYEPKEEAEEDVPAEFDPNAIEVEKKGKEEDESAEAEDSKKGE